MMIRRHPTSLGSHFVRLDFSRQKVDLPSRITAAFAGGLSFWLTLVGGFAQARELFETGVVLGFLAVASPTLSVLSHRLSGALVALITATAWLVSFLVADRALDVVRSGASDPGREFLILLLLCTVWGAEILRKQHDARLRHTDRVTISRQVGALADQVTALTMRTTGELPPSRIAEALRREGEHQLADRAEFFAPQGCRAVVAEVASRSRVPGHSVDRGIAEGARRVLGGSTSKHQ